MNLKEWREAAPDVSTRTNERGFFEFRSVEPGFYKLSAQLPGFATTTYGSGESPFGSIIPREGQRVAGIMLKLTAP